MAYLKYWINNQEIKINVPDVCKNLSIDSEFVINNDRNSCIFYIHHQGKCALFNKSIRNYDT